MSNFRGQPGRTSRRRKRAEEDEPSHERWLISYADFITLLFAFFVVTVEFAGHCIRQYTGANRAADQRG
jgi:hypothetical protein